MEYGAVIVAAGLSSRMGEFKPLLKIGSLSVVQHVIAAFWQAGIRQIAVVTGHNAPALREHLADSGVTFLHNEHYQTTQMFDSAKLGLSYMKQHCERVFFTPVDIPLFTSCTLQKLMDANAPLATPFCDGRQGHPLLLSSSLIDVILDDCGEGGLKGAISRTGIPMTHVEVDDPGVLCDADTPEEFQALLHYYHGSRCPSDAEIQTLLADAGTPENVRAHCAAVANKAAFLAAQTTLILDTRMLRAACLLHDIARTEGKHHAAVGADMVRQAGYPRLADLIAQHHDLLPDACVEAQLLFLADKLIQGTQEVTISERFEAARQKCTTPEAFAAWEARYQNTLALINQLQLGCLLEQKGEHP